jgi:hypothetical protein
MTNEPNMSRHTAFSTKCRFMNAVELSAKLRRLVRSNLSADGDFRSLERALEAIPVATDEYAWLRIRIGNAKMYVNSREFCAAAFELALVMNRLLTRSREYASRDTVDG